MQDPISSRSLPNPSTLAEVPAPGGLGHRARFRSRSEAAQQLAERLAPHRGARPVILVTDQNTLPMGQRLARQLDGVLDLTLVAELEAPGHPEIAIGSVTETGDVNLEQESVGVPRDYLEAQVERQVVRLQEQRESYRRGPACTAPSRTAWGRPVVVLDDGTTSLPALKAVVRSLAQQGPSHLMVALAVARPETVRALAALVDEVVCLVEDPALCSPCSPETCYADHHAVTPEEACSILRGEPPGLA